MLLRIEWIWKEGGRELGVRKNKSNPGKYFGISGARKGPFEHILCSGASFWLSWWMVKSGAALWPSFLPPWGSLCVPRAAYESREIPQDTKTKVVSQRSQTKSTSINEQFFRNRDFGRPYSVFTLFLHSWEDPGQIRTVKKRCSEATVNGSTNQNVNKLKTHGKVYNRPNKREEGAHPRSNLGYTPGGTPGGGVGKILVIL